MISEKTTEEIIVQKQLESYNERDLNKFLACHSKEIELFNFNNMEPFVGGIENLKKVYGEVFENSPNLKATIKTRIVFDNKVIDEEEVTGRNGTDLLKIIAIYEVESNLISKVTFIRAHQ